MPTRVLILARTHTEYQNGLLIYLEAKSQGKGVDVYALNSPDRDIIRVVKDGGYQWVMITGMANVSKELMENIKKYAKIMVWDADAVNPSRVALWEEKVGIPDLIVNSTLDVVERFKEKAQRLEWVPQYFDSEFCKTDKTRLDVRERIYDVGFLGNSAGDVLRCEWLRKLKLEGFDAFYGGTNPNLSNIATHGHQMVEIYKQCKIVIDVKRQGFFYGNFTTSDRIFKALGSGAFYLTFEIPKLEKLFKPGVHLETYSDYDNMIEKIKNFLIDNVKREEIALAGQKEVFAKHLLVHRVPQYWTLMEKPERPCPFS